MLRTLLSGNATFGSAIAYILSALTVVFLTLPIHEFAHGWAATRLGDPTPRYQGRMTLNPLAHIDYLGAACILLVGFGWAKPVQVNARNFRSPKRDMALTALAGPVSNLIVAFISLILFHTVRILSFKTGVPVLLYVEWFFFFIAQINVSLAVFNLIPIPPLDGSRLLSALLPDRAYYALMRYERFIFFGLLLLLWIGVLDRPLTFLAGSVMKLLDTLAGLFFPI